jgi:deoxyribonuclease-4
VAARRRRVGCHLFVSGGLPRALDRAEERGCDALQVFPSNPRGWAVPHPDERAERALADGVAERGWPLFLHAPYLVNVSSPDPLVRDRSVANLAFALERGTRLGAVGVVVHTGSARGAPRDEAVGRAAGVLVDLAERHPDTQLLVELTAGSGEMIAASVEELTELLAACDDHPRVRACLDTCHLYAAGHDLRSTAGRRRLRNAIRELGPERVAVVHVNDSRDPLDSRRDRHARIGTGTIGLDALRTVLRWPELRHAPLLLETPGDADEQRSDVALLRDLVA